MLPSIFTLTLQWIIIPVKGKDIWSNSLLNIVSFISSSSNNIYICSHPYVKAMYNKILIASLMLLPLVSVNAQSSSKSVASADPNAPIMSFDTKEHDFGTIEQDGNGVYLFLFTNTGKEPLVIKESRGSCGCTVPKWPHNPVAPGHQDTIKVTYDTHRIGFFQKTVTITSNATESPLVLSIKGKVNAKPPLLLFLPTPAIVPAALRSLTIGTINNLISTKTQI